MTHDTPAEPPLPPRSFALRSRLSLLMFLQYAAPGAVVPLYSLRLENDLHFSPMQISLAAATGAMAALIAPLVAGQLADRWLPAERCLTVCGLLAGTLAWLLAEVTSPLAVFAVSLAFWLVMVPTMTLGVSITFTHLDDPARQYGGVRLWGTVGWMVPGWLLGYWFSNPEWPGALGLATARAGYGDAFRLAGILGVAVGLYGFTLPHTPPQHRVGAVLAPLAALHLLRSRSFAVFAVCALGVCVTMPFSTQATPLLLAQLGIPRELQGPTLTLAQTLEVVGLGFLPMLLLRFGLRGTMLLGLVSWAVALSVLTVGRPLALVIASLGLHGLCICCFLVAGQVFMNSRARGDVRASIQGLFTFISGAGLLIGNLSVGAVRHAVGGNFVWTFAVATVLTVVLVGVFLAGFDENEPVQRKGLPPE